MFCILITCVSALRACFANVNNIFDTTNAKYMQQRLSQLFQSKALCVYYIHRIDCVCILRCIVYFVALIIGNS